MRGQPGFRPGKEDGRRKEEGNDRRQDAPVNQGYAADDQEEVWAQERYILRLIDDGKGGYRHQNKKEDMRAPKEDRSAQEALPPLLEGSSGGEKNQAPEKEKIPVEDVQIQLFAHGLAVGAEEAGEEVKAGVLDPYHLVGGRASEKRQDPGPGARNRPAVGKSNEVPERQRKDESRKRLGEELEVRPRQAAQKRFVAPRRTRRRR